MPLSDLKFSNNQLLNNLYCLNSKLASQFFIYIFNLIFIFSTIGYAESNLNNSSANEINNNNPNNIYPAFNLTDWPEDVLLQIKKEAPEITKKKLNAFELNQILKKLDQKMQFNSLKIVLVKNELRLVGEISATVEKIQFQGLKDISENEALNILNINLKNALDPEILKTSTEKLAQYYKEQGYRFTEINYEILSNNSLKKTVLIKMNIKNQTRLKEIKIEGLDQNTNEKIQKHFTSIFKKPILTQDYLNQINIELRHQLSINGYILSAVPSPQIVFSADEATARIVYKILKSPAYSIEVSNSFNYSHLYLENEILNLDTYSAKDNNFSADLVDKLKTFYLSQGYPHIEISPYEKKINDKITLVLNVEEGPYTEFKKINFIGHFSRPESFYQKKLLEFGSNKLKSMAFVKSDIELAAKNLITDLQNEGYVNAKLGRVQVETSRENLNEGTAYIQIEEGFQVLIDEIIFEGISSQKNDELLKIMQLHEGQTLNLKQLELALLALKNHYNNLGFIEFKLTNQSTDMVTYIDKNSKVKLKFQIQEGPRVEVQSILIEGNEITHDKVLLTEIDFKVGDTLNPAKIEESISRLQRTGHFTSVEILTVEAGTSQSQRTVLIKVLERDPGIYTIGAGATNENKGTLHGYTGIAYRNIGGVGQGLSARLEGNYNFADVKYLESKITLGGVQPYLFNSRARLRLNITRSRSISDYSQRKVTELNLGVLSIEQDFTSHITGIWDLWSVATYVDHGIDDEDDRKYNLRQDQVIGSTGPTIDVDYRDNIFNPSSGSFSRFSIEYSSDFLSNHKVDDFIRANAQSTWYFPIENGRLVFAQSVSAGYVENLKSSDAGVPFDKKGFTLGGRTSIRGFNSSEFFPSNQPQSESFIGTQFKLMKSAEYQLIKSELRFPLIPKFDLMGAFFYDGGQVLITDIEIKDKWRDALGIGLRYNTPIGPVNLEYAKKLDRKDGESDSAFHLSVGVF